MHCVCDCYPTFQPLPLCSVRHCPDIVFDKLTRQGTMQTSARPVYPRSWALLSPAAQPVYPPYHYSWKTRSICSAVEPAIFTPAALAPLPAVPERPLSARSESTALMLLRINCHCHFSPLQLAGSLRPPASNQCFLGTSWSCCINHYAHTTPLSAWPARRPAPARMAANKR